ncbi:MAG TPA: CmcJ/NvfI family oxidoreductase [Noviherbaspirillum sp.]|nr:CmcJ/NvfI family oxidoreductase [Noviherbaspirillum sp.]
MRHQSPAVTGELGYVVPSTEKPYNYMYEPPPGQAWENCEYERRPMRIHDARMLASALGLEQSGFELRDHPLSGIDFDDGDAVRAGYYREIELLALALTGGEKAIVFDHQVRRREPGRPALAFGRKGDGKRPSAVGRVHNDYSEQSGRRRLQLVLGDAPNDRPYMILNFWRPFIDPAIDTPLAVCDARSFARGDWVAADIRYPDRTGEIYLARYSPMHMWYYYPRMTPDEVLVFKSYDSRLDCPVRMTPHCAFDDPSAPADAPLRKSIEARCLVILE